MALVSIPAATIAQAIADLTPRERAVVAQLATHRTYAEIGRELYVSTNTVKTHVAHVYMKLGVARRSDAVARAIVLGLIDAPAAPARRILHAVPTHAPSLRERARAARAAARATCRQASASQRASVMHLVAKRANA